LTVAVDRALAGVEKLVDVGLFDRMPAELDLDIGKVADEPRRAVARPYVLDRHAAHAFGQFDGLADGKFARRHVGDIAALDPAALALAGAEHGRASLLVEFGDHRAHLGRANVERGDEVLLIGLHHWLSRPRVAPALPARAGAAAGRSSCRGLGDRNG